MSPPSSGGNLVRSAPMCKGRTEAVADPCEREHQAGDERAGNQRDPRMVRGEEVGVLLDDVAPGGHGNLGTYAEKGKSCFDQNGG